MIQSFDLSTARDRVSIPATLANPMELVTVAQLPAGNTVRLHFGHGDPGVPVSQEQQSLERDPPELGGLFVSNGVGAGLLVLEIHFRTYQAPIPVVDVRAGAGRGTQPAGFVDQLLKNFGLKR